MIHHLSIAARDPQRAAVGLGRIDGGKAVPFHPIREVSSRCNSTSTNRAIEVYPAGTERAVRRRRRRELCQAPGSRRAYGATHFALSVTTEAHTVEQMPSAPCWECFRCNRGPFHVMERLGRKRDDGRDPARRILPANILAFTRPDKVLARMRPRL